MWILIEIEGNDTQKIGRDELRRLISFEEIEAEKSHSSGSSLIKGVFNEAHPATPFEKGQQKEMEFLAKAFAGLMMAGGVCPHCEADLKNSEGLVAFEEFMSHIDGNNEREEWRKSVGTLQAMGGK